MKALVMKRRDSVVIVSNGKKLVLPLTEKYKSMTKEEILENFLSERSSAGKGVEK